MGWVKEIRGKTSFAALLIGLALLGQAWLSGDASAMASGQVQGTAARGEPCSFDCYEVPSPDEVIYHFADATRPALPKRTLKVLVWNVYKGQKPAFRSTFNELTKNVDLVILSEVVLDQKVGPALLDLAGFGWVLSANFLMANRVPTGPAIGSAVHPKNVRYKKTVAREPFVGSPKTTVIAEFPIAGSKDTLLVAGIHGINFTPDVTLRDQVNDISKEFRKHRGPIIFAGDFNIRNQARFDYVNQVATEHGLSRAPWQNDYAIYYQFDDAFTKGLNVKWAEIISEVEGIGSDHPALYMEVDLAK